MPCNGDTGGGFFVFIPDSPEAYNRNPKAPGSYYLSGIVSLMNIKEGKRLCDVFNYVLITDIDLYASWIQTKMMKWIF